MSVAQKLFTVHEVARIFGLKESRIRYWSQTGFVSPSGSRGNRRLYSFSDLVGIKAAKELLDQGVPLQKVRKNLQALRKALPNVDQPLNQLRVRSDGAALVVDHEKGSFEPLSGQLVLDFDVDAVGSQAAQILHLQQRRAEAPPEQADGGMIHTGEPDEPSLESPTTAYAWFMRGCALDSAQASEQEAAEAYRRALELDPSLAAACTNLGNLLYRINDREAALHYYQQACTLDPDQPEARYNLANLLEEDGEADMAIAEYRQVLRLAPDFKDAHFNLALTLERVGSKVQAISHWKRFLELAGDPEATDDWVQVARAHLKQLNG